MIPGSHPCAAVERGLQLKGIPYQRVDLLPGISPVFQKLAFGRRTVPGLRIGGSKVVGSRLILRTIDSLVPEPRLVPEDPELRARVEEADEWGERVLQDETRPISLSGIAARSDSAESFLEGAKVVMPKAIAGRLAGPIFRIELRALGFSPPRVREILDALPSRLDHADSLVGDGVIGDADHPNVADLQIGSSIALLGRLDDLRPLLDGRPCKTLADTLFPDFPGYVPAGALDVRVPARAPAAA